MIRQRTFLQLAAWAFLTAWWFGCLGLMLVQTSHTDAAECYFGTSGRELQLGLGLVGTGLGAYRLLSRSNLPEFLGLIVGTIFLVWLVIVTVWMPSLTHYCEGG